MEDELATAASLKNKTPVGECEEGGSTWLIHRVQC